MKSSLERNKKFHSLATVHITLFHVNIMFYVSYNSYLKSII